MLVESIAARRAWSVKPGAPMPGKRFGHCAALLPDNKHVLVSGGHDGVDYVENGMMFSLEEGTWLEKPFFTPPTGAKVDQSCATVRNL